MSFYNIPPEKTLFVESGDHCYFEYTEDLEAIKRGFEQMAKFCMENKIYCFNNVNIIIKDKEVKAPHKTPTIGIRWKVGEKDVKSH